MSFKTYLNEEHSNENALFNFVKHGICLTESKETITHLNHIEDYVIINGKNAFTKFSDDVSTILSFFEQQKALTVSVKIDGCVHPDTVIKTKEGDKTIMKIIKEYNQGKTNEVLTYNEETGKEEWCLAEYPRINDNNKNWIEVEMENGENLKLTEDHEVYVEGKGWIEAKNLLEDDDIKEIKNK
jgi:hypothetical protein